MTPTEQRDAARLIANEKRMAVARVRRQLRNGEITLQEVFDDPPAELHGYTIADVFRMARCTQRYAGSSSLKLIGQWAIRDQVNLMITLGEASARTRGWAATHGTRGLPGNTGRRKAAA